MTKRYLNIGCGRRFHPDWVNVDLVAASPMVRSWDIHKDFPFPDSSFDVVYHSHVLEHFPRAEGLEFLSRCRRVLRRDGILRIAVPDLEKIARLYLAAFDRSLAGDTAARSEYDWALIEMYDQAVRVCSGGEMAKFVRGASPSLLAFVRSRIGSELDGMLIATDSASRANNERIHPVQFSRRFCRKVLHLLLGSKVLGTYDEIKFRRSGEIHRWMYDRYSLRRALVDTGFSSPRQVGPVESSIPDWVEYHLDTEPDGSTYKPDSIYMEATRP